MYRHSPVRNQRSKGIKTKHVVQVCLLLAVCFWLIFQLKRSHHNNKHFDHPNISRADQILKFGRKDLQPKLQDTTTAIQMHQEQQDEENKHEEEEQDEDKTDEGGGDDEIDENEQDKSNMQIDRDEVDIIDEDRDTEESDEDKVTEEKDENTADHDEDGSTEHTHEAREEHYKADDASSAVITHDPGNEIKNATLDDNSSENGGNENRTLIQEKDSESTPSMDFHENVNTTSNTTVQGFSKNSSDESISENLERNVEDPTHLEEKEVRNDLETLPDVETEGGNSEDTAAE